MGVGVAWGLFCVWDGVESVVTWERWLKKDDIEGRRLRILADPLMPCSTGGKLAGLEKERQVELPS